MANAARPTPISAPTVEQDPGDAFDITKARLIRRGPRPKHAHGVRFPLAAIRKAAGKTQAEIAVAAGLDQSTIARLERQPDPQVSSLAKYAAALGGTVDVVIVIDGRRFIVAPPASHE